MCLLLHCDSSFFLQITTEWADSLYSHFIIHTNMILGRFRTVKRWRTGLDDGQDILNYFLFYSHPSSHLSISTRKKKKKGAGAGAPVGHFWKRVGLELFCLTPPPKQMGLEFGQKAAAWARFGNLEIVVRQANCSWLEALSLTLDLLDMWLCVQCTLQAHPVLRPRRQTGLLNPDRLHPTVRIINTNRPRFSSPNPQAVSIYCLFSFQ